MTQVHFLDHVAVLVTSLESTCARLNQMTPLFGPIESFESEGTRERYIGTGGAASRLLLMQATNSDGPYGQALKRRGPGLHHLSINVLELGSYIDGLTGSGWYLLPRSLRTIASSRTAWLARPGVPTLIEVHERNRTLAEPVVTLVELPGGGKPDLLLRLAPPSGAIAGLEPSLDTDVWLTVGGRRTRALDLAAE